VGPHADDSGYPEDVDFREVRTVLLHRLPIFLVVLMAVVSITFVYVSAQPNEYESAATVALLPDPANPSAAVVYSGLVTSLLPTYVQLAESRSFLDGVGRQLPTPASGAQLHVFASPVHSAGALKLVARARNPVQAEETATAVASAFLAALKDNGVVVIRVIDQPRLPMSPVSP
jgi:capsular polysaccharide biosynthesis protein